ncbi:MAG: hypothetical protein RBU37_00055 [Myxococcota bacterium]|nr:hypothetical protein [Myxococcota bacterium]
MLGSNAWCEELPASEQPPLPVSEAFEERLALGFVVGLNRSILTAPEDAVGEAQFMSGTAFNGFGVSFGPSARFGILPFLALRLELLFSLDRATGYEKLGEQSRELELSTWRLRVPVQILGGYDFGFLRLDLGLGPELALPLTVDATLEEKNIPIEASFPLSVSAGASFGLRMSAGVAVELGEGLFLPSNVHLSWFPGVPDTSRERFEGFQSMTQPGKLRVEYQWCVLWDIGISYEL